MVDEPTTIRIERYRAQDAGLWNGFIPTARNGHFMFDRSYMDYHADRFADHSLIAWEGDKVAALMPANERDAALISHGGLTFGGLVTGPRMSAGTTMAILRAVRDYLKQHGLQYLFYKAIPHIYHRVPAEEDLYALTALGARHVRRDLSSAIDLQNPLPLAKGRKWSAAKARREQVVVQRSADLETFQGIVKEQLQARHSLTPTHTAAEIALLASRFPNNIKLFAAEHGGAMLGGILMYETERVAHAQYIGATEAGRALSCVDAIMAHLLTREYAGRPGYFDFGISTEDDGRYLNLGLVLNKETYGARGIVHDFYRLDAAE
jgi:hypothetical protein